MPRLSLPLAGPALLLLPAVQVLMKRRLSLPDGAVRDHQGARLNRWRCLYDDVCSWDQRLWPHSSLLQLSFISLLCWWPPPYPVFSLSFACQVQYPAQQNVAVQCACAQESGGVCTAVRLRACRDIQAGAELLIYGDPEGKSRTTGLSGGSAGLRGAAAFAHVSKKHECTIMTLMFNYLMLIWTPKTVKLSSSEQSNLPKMNDSWSLPEPISGHCGASSGFRARRRVPCQQVSSLSTGNVCLQVQLTLWVKRCFLGI